MNFNEIFKQNKNSVKNIIRLITKESNEDLEQEVYIKAWKNSGNYTENGGFKNWINTIAKNVSKDYLKSSYIKHEHNSFFKENTLNTITDNKLSPEMTVIKTERQKNIIQAINSLNPKLKQVIVYYEVYGYSYEHCSNKLKCPIGTIKSRIYNAKKELAKKLHHLM